MAKKKYFFEELKSIDNDKEKFKSIELLMDYYDELLCNQQYELCDEHIREFIKRDYSYRLHVSLLTITYRRKKHLNTRPELWGKTKTMAEALLLTPIQIDCAIKHLA